MPHLLAALHHDTRVVAAQRPVVAESNEIPAAAGPYLNGRGGHYVLTVVRPSPRVTPAR